MQLNYKSAAILAIAIGGLVAGAYSIGRKQSQLDSAQKLGQATTAPQAGPLKPGAQVPPGGHPPMAGAGAPPEPQREGKVQVDPTRKFTHFRVGEKNVKSMFNDGDVMWVGTSGGVIRYDTKTDEFRLWDAKTGLLSNGVFYVGKLQGRIAVGTYGGGLSILNERDKTWKTYNIPDGLGDAFVYDAVEMPNGDIWIATWSGANRVVGGKLDDRSKWELYTVENTKGGLPNDWVYGLDIGKNGDVWMATEGGLARFRDGKWENWNHKKGLSADYALVKDDITFKNDPAKVSSHHSAQKKEMGLEGIDVAYNPNYIVALAVDAAGNVWAGTWGGGLSRYDGKTWKHWTVKDGLPGNHVFMLHYDRKGQLWVGTNNGLARMTPDGKFDILNEQGGLFANNVFSMATQANGDLWVGSYGGVTHVRANMPDQPKAN